MVESKDEMRKKLRAARQGLTRSQVDLKSQQILNLAKSSINWSDISALHIFLPMASSNEPQTSGILDYVWTKYPDINTYSSVILPESKGMLIVPISSTTSIAINSVGIPEPLGEQSVHPKLDLVFVPMIGFDASGNRLGFGSGYYDRFLKVHASARKIGLAFELSKVDAIEVRPHDIKLDGVITEDKYYKL